jgi:hypothetical protein
VEGFVAESTGPTEFEPNYTPVEYFEKFLSTEDEDIKNNNTLTVIKTVYKGIILLIVPKTVNDEFQIKVRYLSIEIYIYCVIRELCFCII